jgi:hypothetical protein
MNCCLPERMSMPQTVAWSLDVFDPSADEAKGVALIREARIGVTEFTPKHGVKTIAPRKPKPPHLTCAETREQLDKIADALRGAQLMIRGVEPAP